VDRKKYAGYCKKTEQITAARAALHMWEEPVISGTKGSGTVFFSGCPLGCVFCQNHSIALGKVGKEISTGQLVEIFFSLKEKGANNINLVTPTHYLLQIRQALESAKRQGLGLPIVYNTGSYEKAETLKMLEGLVDVYLPDMKYCAADISKKYANAPDYFVVAAKAIEEMVRQTGTMIFYKEGFLDEETFYDGETEGILMKKGVIVRHLLLPGCVEDSKKIIKYLYEKYENQIYLSIMNQYTPIGQIGENYPELGRKVTDEEYDEVIDYAIEIGVEQAFIQEGDTALESFIPEFDCECICS
jgi:putative pyruvate formate lyase activating enzyme